MTQQHIKVKMSQTFSDFSIDMQLHNIFVDYISGTDTGPGTWQEKVDLKTHFFNKPMKFIYHTFSYYIAHHFQRQCKSMAGKGMELNQE